MDCCSEQGTQLHLFDARGIARRFRHSAIFGALEALDDGETMRFVNDHDPLPLLAQLTQRYGPQLGIEYVDRSGPVVIDFHIRLDANAGASQTQGEGAGSCGGSGGCGCGR